jgi:hypothetical protein
MGRGWGEATRRCLGVPCPFDTLVRLPGASRVGAINEKPDPFEMQAKMAGCQRLRQVDETMVVCAECRYGSDQRAAGWKAFLTAEEDGSEGVEVFCPECAKEAFGDAC